MHTHILLTNHVWFNCFACNPVLCKKDKRFLPATTLKNNNDSSSEKKILAKKLLKTFSFSLRDLIKLKRNNG